MRPGQSNQAASLSLHKLPIVDPPTNISKSKVYTNVHKNLFFNK